MLWVGIAVAVLLSLFIVVGFVGLCLPADHEVVRTVRLGKPPETVWDAITHFAEAPTWNPNLQEVERLPDNDGCEVWRETYRSKDKLTLRTSESVPPSRLVREIVEAGLPFRGSWEFVIEPATGGCRVTVTERGEISNPLMRLMFRLFHDPTRTLDEYLGALAGRFGEPLRFE